MSEDVNAKIKDASRATAEGAQALADASGSHVELAIAIFGVIYYHYYHPPTCAERDALKELPAHDDIPEVFKKMFDNGELPNEPDAEPKRD